MLAGGVLMLWIAYRLLSPEEKADDGHGGVAAVTFWGAMKTIVIADAIMGLDNVLAVAGAAHGSYALVVLGLLISVPIVIWGSTLVLKWVERFPGVVYVGAAVLAWTAAKMIASEPLLSDPLSAHEFAIPLLYTVAVAGVLWAGFAEHRRRLERGIIRRIAERGRAHGSARSPSQGGATMQRILVPVDASKNTEVALRHVAQRALGEPLDVHLLNVQPPFSRHIAKFVPRRSRQDYHREQADKAFARARDVLRKHGIAFTEHVRVGHKAPTIAEVATRHRFTRVVMAAARRGSLARMLDASVTSAVLDRTSVPVEVIAGGKVSALERYGVPAGVGAVILAFVLAVE
ncbi:MAG: YjbE family putative metal transport protein [Burkholderiales bacterium]